MCPSGARRSGRRRGRCPAPRRGGKAGAVDVGAAHVAVGPDRDPVARRREQIAADVGGEIGDLLRGAARGRDPPQLIAARSVAQIIDPAPVGGEMRVVLIMLGRRGDAGRRRIGMAEVEQEKVGAAAIGGEVGLAQLVDHPMAVRRHRRRGEASHGGEIGGGDRAGGGGRRLGESERGEAREHELLHEAAA